MRVDIVVERERMRDFHLHSFVNHNFIIEIERTFLSFRDDWILNFDVFASARA